MRGSFVVVVLGFTVWMFSWFTSSRQREASRNEQGGLVLTYSNAVKFVVSLLSVVAAFALLEGLPSSLRSREFGVTLFGGVVLPVSAGALSLDVFRCRVHV